MAKRKNKKAGSFSEPMDIYDAWHDFSKEISERIKDMTKEGADEYKDLYEIWTEYAQKMTEQMGKFTPEDGLTLKSMQKMWSDYSNRIGDGFGDIISKDNGPYRELYQIWTEYSGRMSESLSELMSENIKSQRDLYELWMDAFGMKDVGQDERFFRDMSSFWMDMWGKSNYLFPAIPDTNYGFDTKYKELNDLWTKNYSKMVMNFIRSQTFAEMNGNILDSNLEAIRANQEFINQYLSTIGMPTKENIDEIYSKLHDLDKKVSEISRAVKSQKTRRKK
jgi:gas vesicle protein